MNSEYYKNENSVSEYIKISEGINGNELIIKLNNYLPKGSTILELGSGPGSDWKILSEFYITTGSDYSPVFLKYLHNKYPEGKFLNLDATTLESTVNFDGIYSNKVLHHLTEEELVKSIKKQHELLNSTGIVCHSFWKGDGSEFFQGMFVQYYSEETINRYFEKYFEIVVLAKYKEFENNDSILLIAKKIDNKNR